MVRSDHYGNILCPPLGRRARQRERQEGKEGQEREEGGEWVDGGG